MGPPEKWGKAVPWLAAASVQPDHDTQGLPAAPNEKAQAALATRTGWAANFAA